MKRLIAYLLAILVMGCAIAVGQDVPAFDERLGYVQDHARIFSENECANLNRTLEAFDSATSIEIIVATTSVQTVDDMAGFTQRVFDKWGPGKKSLNNGIILHMNFGEYRDVRIHTGYGIEKDLTDITSGHIIDNDMADLILAKKYTEALFAGVNGIKNALGSKAWDQRIAYRKQVEEQRQKDNAEAFQSFLMVMLWLACLGGIAALIIIPFVRKRSKERLRTEVSDLLDQAAMKCQRVPGGVLEAESSFLTLSQKYPKSAWAEFQNLTQKVTTLCATQSSLNKQARKLLESSKRADIVQAKAIVDQAYAAATAAVGLVLGVSQRLHDLKVAEREVPEKLTKTISALEFAKKSVYKEGVGATAKDYYVKAVVKIDSAKLMVAIEPVDWLLANAAVEEATNLMAKALSEAEEDINPHQHYSSPSMSRSTDFSSPSRNSGGGGGYKPGGGASGGGGAGRRF
jgi:uncharacterized protein